jgi:chromatin remodeling complex protein RSC6
MSSAAASTKATGRKTKSETVAKAAAEVVAPVVAAPAVAAPAVAAPVAAPVVEAPAVVAAAVPQVQAEQPDAFALMAQMMEHLVNSRNSQTAVIGLLKQLEKRVQRDAKNSKKNRRAAKDPNAPKKATTFQKPVPINDALCVFLGMPKGSSMCRSDVTKKVCDYAKEKGLMVKQNINPDPALTKLLGLTENNNLTILNLQAYLKHLYIKPAVVATA